jgi:hypothetical protein
MRGGVWSKRTPTATVDTTPDAVNTLMTPTAYPELMPRSVMYGIRWSTMPELEVLTTKKGTKSNQNVGCR